MSNVLKPKRDKIEKEDKGFKFTDHLVTSSSETGVVFNKILVKVHNMYEINTMIATMFPTKSVDKTNKKSKHPKYRSGNQIRNTRNNRRNTVVDNNSISWIDRINNSVRESVRNTAFRPPHIVLSNGLTSTVASIENLNIEFTLELDTIASLQEQNRTIQNNFNNSVSLVERGRLSLQLSTIRGQIEAHEYRREILEQELDRREQISVNITDVDIEEVQEEREEVDPFDTPDYFYNSTDNEQSLSKTEEEKLDMFSTLTRSFTTFKQQCGTDIGIIKGYIIDEVLWCDNEGILDYIKVKKPKRVQAIVKVSTIQDGRIKNGFKLMNTGEIYPVQHKEYFESSIPLISNITLTGFESSDLFFGVDPNREYLIKEKNLPWRLDYITIVRSKTRFNTYVVVIEDPQSKKEVRFVLFDCNLHTGSAKGYIIPKNKTIGALSIVKIRQCKLDKYGYKNGSPLFEVVKIMSNPSSKVISRSCKNRRLDVATIQDPTTGRKLDIYLQDLKFVKNKIKENVNTIKEEFKGNFYETVHRLRQQEINEEVFNWATTTTTTSLGPL